MKIIGHRGAKGLAPENTLASFAKALEYNVDEIECDARVTSDGVVILEHDDWMHDVAGNKQHVTKSTHAELLAHKPDLLTLEAAIVFINKRIPIQIEVKEREQLKPIIKVVDTLLAKGWQPKDFVFSSYNFKVLQELHAAIPAIEVCVIESWSGVRATYHARKINTKRISMDQRWLWRGFIAAMSRRGYLLTPFTINNARRARIWAKYGMHAAITDYPDQFKAKRQ